MTVYYISGKAERPKRLNNADSRSRWPRLGHNRHEHTTRRVRIRNRPDELSCPGSGPSVVGHPVQ